MLQAHFFLFVSKTFGKREQFREWWTRKPQTRIRNLESRIRNPDIMNDDRDNSLQQCLINKYRKILFCWPAKLCSGDLYQYQFENSVDLELLSVGKENKFI